MVWHDYVYGQDQIVHAAVWTSDVDAGPDLQITYLGSAAFDGLTKIVNVSDSSRAAGVVTITVPDGHGLLVGDRLLENLDDGTFGVVELTAVGDTWAQFDQAGEDTPSGGGGTVQDLDQVMPYWVHAKLVGTTLAYKVWPAGEPEPAWDDPTWVRVFEDTDQVGPVGEGYDGIYAGHIRNETFVEYGPVDIFSLDPPPGPATAAAPPARIGRRATPSDPAAVRARTDHAGLPRVHAGSSP